MSGFKKVIQRHPYRERTAPSSRKRLGLLEKHKDYSLRAASFNKKKAQLASLREKAANRNEDEFYFGMLSRSGPTSSASTLVRGASNKSWTGTVNGDRGNTALDMDTVRLLKTQDIGYVRTMRNVAAKEVRVLKQKLVTAEAMTTSGGQTELEREDEDTDGDDSGFNFGAKTIIAPGKPKKIVFLDDVDERDERIDADTRQNDGNDEEAEADEDKDDERYDPRKLEFQRLKRRLQNAEKRLQVLSQAEQEMEQQRARMAKTPTKGVVTKKGQKLKVRERKR